MMVFYDYDVILIDTPPAKGLITRASLHASTHVLIPSVMEQSSMKGLVSLINTINNNISTEQVQSIDIIGLLPSKFDSRQRPHKDNLGHVKNTSLSDYLIYSTAPNPDEISGVVDGVVVAKERSAIKYMEQENGFPINLYQTIRVRPNDPHGGTASDKGGAFISIQHWLNNVEPTHVSSNWGGNYMGKEHLKQANTK